ncbi:MAG: hypothetical protein Q9216_006122 [Gyalolechia sp. 2 TL-2023]
MADNPSNPRDDILKSLQGQMVWIPDLQRLFDHWPQDINPHVEQLREHVDERLESSLASDLEHAQRFRNETVAYIRDCLTEDNGRASTVKSPLHPIITSFEPIGKAIRDAYNPAKVDIFLREVVKYVEMCGVEQEFQMSQKLPTIEEYHERRLGSGGVGPCLAITE